MTRTTATLGRFLARWGLPLLVLAAGLGLALYGLLEVNRYTRTHIRGSGRYLVAFAQLDCTPPPTLNRADFLAEVQYLTNQPAQLNVLDEHLGSRLAAAFAQHPWVQQVQRVEVTPPRRVQIRLNYRVPVMAVSLEGQMRAVDRDGVLLPSAASTAGLPVYRGPLGAVGPAGKPLDDRGVRAAAATAGFFCPQQDRLAWTAIEFAAKELILDTASDTRVVWGNAPGAEAKTEATAVQKRERLERYCTEHGSLDQPAGPYEHDVRNADRLITRALRE